MVKWFGLAGLLSMVAWLVSCGSSEGLEAIRQDPISTVTLANSELVAVVEKGSSSSLGQPTAAVLQRSFAPVSGNDLETLLATALEVSEEEGWDFQEEDVGRFYRGTKLIGEQEIELAVYIYDEEAVVVLNMQLSR